MKKVMIVVACLFMLHGCGYGVRGYQPSINTYKQLEGLAGQGNVAISVGSIEFADPGVFESMCRGIAPIVLPGDQPFNAYIRDAIIEELTLADVYDADSPCVLHGEIIELSFDSWANAAWRIDVIFTTSSGESFPVRVVYEFRGGVNPDLACQEVATTFRDAVQQFITKLVKNEKFIQFATHCNAG